MANRTCSVDGCERIHRARGLCALHYRWAYPSPSAGRPRIRPRRPRPATPIERFWRTIRRDSTGCWLWTGVIDRYGYGSLSIRSVKNIAHRYSYELLVGPIPEGLQLDHTCHTADASCPGGPTCLHRRCVNPAHLEPVTAAENTRRSPLVGRRPGQVPTHCGNGHEYTEENTVWCRERRVCRACNKARRLRYLDRKRAAA